MEDVAAQYSTAIHAYSHGDRHTAATLLEEVSFCFLSFFPELLPQLLPIVGPHTPNVHLALGIILAEMHEKEKAVQIY